MGDHRLRFHQDLRPSSLIMSQQGIFLALPQFWRSLHLNISILNSKTKSSITPIWITWRRKSIKISIMGLPHWLLIASLMDQWIIRKPWRREKLPLGTRLLDRNVNFWKERELRTQVRSSKAQDLTTLIDHGTALKNVKPKERDRKPSIRRDSIRSGFPVWCRKSSQRNEKV